MRLKQASSSLAQKDVMFQGIQGPPVGKAGAMLSFPRLIGQPAEAQCQDAEPP